MTLKTIFQLIQETHPNAGQNYVRLILNESLKEMAHYKPVIKQASFNLIEDQKWYPIGDHNSDLKIDKVQWVAINDTSGVPRQIPRLLDGYALTEKDLV